MNENVYFKHPIYTKYFGGLRNVRIVPQETHDESPERKHVHYPLAKMIASGDLSQQSGFESYIKKM